MITASDTSIDFDAGMLWQPRFPNANRLCRVAKLIPTMRDGAGQTLDEGPRWELVLAPGAIQVRTRDWARSERADERATQRRIKQIPPDSRGQRQITEWSRQSRANMVKTLCQLDYAPMLADPTRLPAMLTLTYSGDWVTVAPSGKAVKAHLEALRKRYQRAWGEDLTAVWKLEFQRRGAPHVHLLMVPPHGMSRTSGQPFRQWVSQAWADIVAHPDPEEYRKHLLAGTGVDFAQGLRSTDPRRVAVYFTKHGSFADKAYQHRVPPPWQEPDHGPGRFWGYWGLRPVRITLVVTPSDGVAAGRLLRRWARAQGTTRETIRPRVERSTGRVRYHKTRVRVRRLGGCRGWVSVNDGAVFIVHLADALRQTARDRCQSRIVTTTAHGLH